MIDLFDRFRKQNRDRAWLPLLWTYTAVLWTAMSLGSCAAPSATSLENKPRVIISTDIGGTDPDDFQSMIHYLMYADRFRTEGLIASPYGEGRAADVLKMIDLYELDFPILEQHADFPDPDQLRAVTKQGARTFAPPQGWSEPTEGSQWIIQRAKADKPEPLWVLVWGGLEDLAQALHDAPEIAGKLRVYWIGGPNKKWSVHPYLYIARHFPDLWMIEANATYRGWFLDEEAPPRFGNEAYFERAIRGRGAMGSDFVKYYKGAIKMGDTPSVAYLLSGETENPAGESWGGRFVPLTSSAYRAFSRNTDVTDTIPTYSVIEWTLSSSSAAAEPQSNTIWIDIDGQRIDGFYAADGRFSIRFVPKRPGNWSYTIHSSAIDLEGQTGAFVSSNPWPGPVHPGNIRLNNWWTDAAKEDTYIGPYQGARTVARWREEFLHDWAVRLAWLPN